MRVYAAPKAKEAATFCDENEVALVMRASYGVYSPKGSKFTAKRGSDGEIPKMESTDIALVKSLDIFTLLGLMRAEERYREIFEDEDLFLLVMSAEEVSPDVLRRDGVSFIRFKGLSAYLKSLNLEGIEGDISAHYLSAAEAYRTFLIGEGQGLLAIMGEKEIEREDKLNEESFITWIPSGVIIRRSSGDVSRIFHHPREDVLAAGVCSYEEPTGIIRLALCFEIKGVACWSIGQELWGVGVSGDKLFAESPPNQTEEDFKRAVSLFTLKI